MLRRFHFVIVLIVTLAPSHAGAQEIRRVEAIVPAALDAPSAATIPLPDGSLGTLEGGSTARLVTIGALGGAVIGALTVSRGGIYDFPVGYIAICTLLGAGAGYLMSLIARS